MYLLVQPSLFFHIRFRIPAHRVGALPKHSCFSESQRHLQFKRDIVEEGENDFTYLMFFFQRCQSPHVNNELLQIPFATTNFFDAGILCDPMTLAHPVAREIRK